MRSPAMFASLALLGCGRIGIDAPLGAGGRVSCWGRNESGQVGSSDRDDQLSPVAVAALGPATAVSAGGLHTCARLADATAWCWGNNEKGQLGFIGANTPVPSHVLD